MDKSLTSGLLDENSLDEVKDLLCYRMAGLNPPDVQFQVRIAEGNPAL